AARSLARRAFSLKPRVMAANPGGRARWAIASRFGVQSAPRHPKRCDAPGSRPSPRGFIWTPYGLKTKRPTLLRKRAIPTLARRVHPARRALVDRSSSLLAGAAKSQKLDAVAEHAEVVARDGGDRETVQRGVVVVDDLLAGHADEVMVRLEVGVEAGLVAVGVDARHDAVRFEQFQRAVDRPQG